jgi:DNA-binding MarR family transcriptional regulator
MNRPPDINADRDARRVLDALRRVVQSLRTSSRAVEAKVGISGAQLFVLQKLAAEPHLSINDLARRTLTHQSSVSVVATRLVEKGLVVRERAADDARRLVLSITPKGRAVLNRSPMAAQERLSDGLSKMTGADRGRLGELLDRLTELAGLGHELTPPMFFDGEMAAKPLKRKGPQGKRNGHTRS